MKILGISGSIRKASYNTKVLQFVGKHIAKSQPEVNYEIADISQLPLFNEDIEANGAKPPQVVTDFRQKVKEADAIVFSTPEHNYSTPAALKNALDWASRPYGHNVWENKPAAILSASPGYLGGIKAQYALRQIFVFLAIKVLTRPEVVVPSAHTNTSEDGNITNEMIGKNVGQLVDALIQHTKDQAKITDSKL